MSVGTTGYDSKGIEFPWKSSTDSEDWYTNCRVILHAHRAKEHTNRKAKRSPAHPDMITLHIRPGFPIATSNQWSGCITSIYIYMIGDVSRMRRWALASRVIFGRHNVLQRAIQTDVWLQLELIVIKTLCVSQIGLDFLPFYGTHDQKIHITHRLLDTIFLIRHSKIQTQRDQHLLNPTTILG